jgi:hypothetical protein
MLQFTYSTQMAVCIKIAHFCQKLISKIITLVPGLRAWRIE